MTRTRIQRFRRMLESRRAELRHELWRMRPDLATDLRGDPLECARAIAEREFAVRTLDADTAMLRKVEAALHEIEHGTFGRCNACGREIPLKRLEAVPWSLYCVSCQAQLEQEAFEEPFEDRYALAS